jgi:murein DD-endopeptidase MepM/ murein hydrolase activator NlpD
MKMIYPCDMKKAVVTSTFKDHLARPGYTGPGGTDIGSYGGANIPLWDVLGGTVEMVDTEGYNTGWGNYLTVNHGSIDGAAWRSLYAHCKSISVKVGDKLLQGEQFGIMGTTGNSTGVHVHHTLYKNGKAVDPQLYYGYSLGSSTEEDDQEFETEISLPPVPTIPQIKVLATWGLTLREEPRKSGRYIGLLIKGTILPVIKYEFENGNIWAQVGRKQYCAIKHNGEVFVEFV